MKVLERAGEGKRLRARVTSLLGSSCCCCCCCWCWYCGGSWEGLFMEYMCTVNEVTEEKKWVEGGDRCQEMWCRSYYYGYIFSLSFAGKKSGLSRQVFSIYLYWNLIWQHHTGSIPFLLSATIYGSILTGMEAWCAPNSYSLPDGL